MLELLWIIGFITILLIFVLPETVSSVASIYLTLFHPVTDIWMVVTRKYPAPSCKAPS